MVDTEARKQAAHLIREFLDGVIPNDVFHARMGRLTRSGDRALRAIESMLWTMSDHSRTHELSGPDALDAPGQALFDRCLLFVESEKEYEWPQDRFDRTWGTIPVVHVLTLGLTWLLTRWKVKQNQRFLDDLRSSGDLDVWPFLRFADYERAIERRAGQ